MQFLVDVSVSFFAITKMKIKNQFSRSFIFLHDFLIIIALYSQLKRILNLIKIFMRFLCEKYLTCELCVKLYEEFSHKKNNDKFNVNALTMSTNKVRIDDGAARFIGCCTVNIIS